MQYGKIYFWTATIRNWQYLLQHKNTKNIIIDSLEYLSNNGNINVYSFVIMPNHIHLIWKMNKLNGKESPKSSFLKFTAHQFKVFMETENFSLNPYKINSKQKSHEFWQRDPRAFELYSLKMINQKINYIHNNPLQEKWSLVKFPSEYSYSSSSFYDDGISPFKFLKNIYDEF
ncbi:transposase [Flammeovirgaceae bacterium KN852]|uniref:Transposase n=2 Tax=Marinigracilibium pacificum TaxID=2729599 RepID=A0A848ITY0_9BACT|nr:transposase [Marinigracilibium pacificum]